MFRSHEVHYMPLSMNMKTYNFPGIALQIIVHYGCSRKLLCSHFATKNCRILFLYLSIDWSWVITFEKENYSLSLAIHLHCIPDDIIRYRGMRGYWQTLYWIIKNFKLTCGVLFSTFLMKDVDRLLSTSGQVQDIVHSFSNLSKVYHA